MRKLVGVLLSAASLASGSAALAAELVIRASHSGQYSANGLHRPWVVDHSVGRNNQYSPVSRNYFVFDLSRVSGSVTGAVLRLSTGSYWSSDATETYVVHEVTTPIEDLLLEASDATAVYDDLGSGGSYGSRVYSATDTGYDRDVVLNAAALQAIEDALGGQLAMGGRIGSIDTLDPEKIFQATNSVGLTRFLVLSGDVEIRVEAPAWFEPGYRIIDFETGSTALPDVDGVEFVREGSPQQPPWFGGVASSGAWIFDFQRFGNLYSGAWSDLAIAFEPPVRAVGAWSRRFSTNGVDQLSASIFAADGSLLAEKSVTLPAWNEQPVFIGFGSAAPIARVEWRGDGTGSFGVDNVVFGELAAVPSIGAPTLLGVLLAALGWRKLRSYG